MSIKELKQQFLQPSNNYSAAPFWFWNDVLDRVTLASQMKDFREKGVYAFVIHPRIGLPESIGFLSEVYLDWMQFVIEEASRTGMKVWLYDEAMYPSGSAHGMVVKMLPEHASRGLKVIEVTRMSSLELLRIQEGERLISAQKARLLPDGKLEAESLRIMNVEEPIGYLTNSLAKDEVLLLFVEHYTGGLFEASITARILMSLARRYTRMCSILQLEGRTSLLCMRHIGSVLDRISAIPWLVYLLTSLMPWERKGSCLRVQSSPFPGQPASCS
ncbi:hypothetical protein [Paenibacillus konkukensis]|nr:hypothetical protein [Paenibacillus konkukensis]